MASSANPQSSYFVIKLANKCSFNIDKNLYPVQVHIRRFTTSGNKKDFIGPVNISYPILQFSGGELKLAMEVNNTQQATNRTMRLVNEHLEGNDGTIHKEKPETYRTFHMDQIKNNNNETAHDDEQFAAYDDETYLGHTTLYDTIIPNNNIQAACDDEFASYDDETYLGPNN
ncbi:unnamed protein product [Adineta steineri]|uniref:Uncharacterized protein n=1 Tax=Adineta steineri TaxID=433720 RepID=A0A815D281_9BILA|nr:unnamed protein product [Adineta steineri]CAF1290520.1 unnamed protein product [Adineta steineri]CAF3742962.1 unnamed protein product [Adineta steineri]CAF4005152.1 unnamed protein product [Adineta steineri]